jgi:glutamate racemase
VELIGAADAAGRAMERYLRENGLEADGSETGDRYYTSGEAGEFERLGKLFLDRDITGMVEFVPPFPV